jgi:hypothetical protein
LEISEKLLGVSWPRIERNKSHGTNTPRIETIRVLNQQSPTTVDDAATGSNR